MKKRLIIIYRYLIAFWIEPILWFKWIKNFFFYIKDFREIKKNKQFSISMDYPCLHDKDDNSWSATGHYFHQDLLVAQKIFKNNPEKHIDIWSRIDWFITHIASYRKIEVFDIRPLQNNIPNVEFMQLDLMQEIPKKYVWYTNSLSCLHTVEHFGLWRYGDKIDIDWHIKWFKQISKILKKWWIFYFSVPIGEKQRIEFNAHRVFSIKYLIEVLFKNVYKVVSFSYVDDRWNLNNNIVLTKENIDKSFWLNYGCGIFELRKIV